MRLHHLTMLIVALLTAAMLALGGAAPTWAASQHPTGSAAHALPAAITLTNRTKLPDTSIDSPALASAYVVITGVDETVLAWTGTDAQHHLNLMTSYKGEAFSNKRTLNEMSPYRPAVALDPVGGAVVIAWTGTNANHSLNVLYNAYGDEGSPIKLTLRDNSIGAPALLQSTSPDKLYLAWTGTDANHSLNLMPITRTAHTLVPGAKTVQSKFSSNTGPQLAAGIDASVALSWTTRALQLRVATCMDAECSTGVPESSAAAPALIYEFLGVTEPTREWIGWTGTDSAHHLNLQWTTTISQFTDPAKTKTTLTDTALSGPALAVSETTGTQIAWTGTDAAHHLNIATFKLA